jgi:hypothetical protein
LSAISNHGFHIDLKFQSVVAASVAGHPIASAYHDKLASHTVALGHCQHVGAIAYGIAFALQDFDALCSDFGRSLGLASEPVSTIFNDCWLVGKFRRRHCTALIGCFTLSDISPSIGVTASIANSIGGYERCHAAFFPIASAPRRLGIDSAASGIGLHHCLWIGKALAAAPGSPVPPPSFLPDQSVYGRSNG